MLPWIVGAALATEPSDPAGWPREFRGAWVATVDNIDWPSKPGLGDGAAEAEMSRLFDRLSEIGINAVVFQVRPMADALYRSDLEPPSWFYTGSSDTVLGADPLSVAVRLAHERGMELHAWCNPFRARHPAMKAPLSKRHVARAQPRLVRTHGNQLWLDPGDPAAREHTLSVFEDIVRRYEVDGFHIDDYFYPYPVSQGGKRVPFDDAATYREFNLGETDRQEWRRANVDRFVESMYVRLKRVKPWVKVGVSPFGVYRPGVPEGVKAGIDQVEDLAADPLKWAKQGWVDYLSPQLYWKVESAGQPFERLARWWAEETVPKDRLWFGLFTSQTNPSGADWPAAEIGRQIALARKHGSGHVHFSAKALARDWNGVGTKAKIFYRLPALVPGARGEAEGVPKVEHDRVEDGRRTLTLAPGPVFYAVSESGRPGKVRGALDGGLTLEVGARSTVVVRSLDREGRLSQRLVLRPR